MLANSPNILQMCSFDANKSTKGASKLRRDLINAEIANLRDLLPLPSSTRQRLSQLQLMALVCVYVRKANYFQHVLHKHDLLPEASIPHFGFSKALNGFLMMMTQNGKLLYISDNAAEYLGHSMEDLLIHGDSVYDIIEKQDHQAIQAELMRSPNPLSLIPDSRIFLCRMNVSRNARRQMRFGDQKVVLVQGHFVNFLPLCSRNEPVFLATCTPVAMPETRECVVQGSTNVFTSIHSMDMKFLHIDSIGEFHLGYRKSNLQGLSWYELVHCDHLREAQSKHRLITQSEQERSCILLIRLESQSRKWIWVHVVLQVKDSSDSSQQPVIVCTNQVLSEREAAVMRANSWLYQFYSLHSKMHYSLAYEAHATRLPSYYSTMMPYPHPTPSGGAIHPSPYHLPPPGAPLNGSSQHPGHTVLQYGGPPPPHGTLPVPYMANSTSCEDSKWQQLKRSSSPENQDLDQNQPKRPNYSRNAFTYPPSLTTFDRRIAAAVPVPLPMAEIGTASYYGPTEMLATVSLSHFGTLRSQKEHQIIEKELMDVEQSLTPTNTEEVSLIISSSSPHRLMSGNSVLLTSNPPLSSVLSESSRILAGGTEDLGCHQDNHDGQDISTKRMSFPPLDPTRYHLLLSEDAIRGRYSLSPKPDLWCTFRNTPAGYSCYDISDANKNGYQYSERSLSVHKTTSLARDSHLETGESSLSSTSSVSSDHCRERRSPRKDQTAENQIAWSHNEALAWNHREPPQQDSSALTNYGSQTENQSLVSGTTGKKVRFGEATSRNTSPQMLGRTTNFSSHERNSCNKIGCRIHWPSNNASD
ncbi:neuronal PAS domain-containing protein 4-like isoform X1 [Centruroides sculpturatus]|uniref:neuronal PAS domain-containing protein 4-like isoform X1 n=2 Tax=Centruroides sculpturatus TaxID=218467 RepID=UPI000C6E7386|nr:neuronal PAS domain-containing protein 4-like isoform X1 [Centruroides sculpturatus]